MKTSFFDSLPIYVTYIGLVLFIFIAFELGYQISKRYGAFEREAEPATLGSMVGGLIGLLGFLLAFTFSIATQQFNARKQYVLEEAVEIGTAYLRADLIDTEYRTEIKGLLKEYVDLRLQAVTSSNISKEIARSVELHSLLWAKATEVAVAKPNTNTAMLVQSINKVIDTHEKRVTGLRNRIPMSIWVTLITISFMTMATIGVKAAFSKSRSYIATLPLMLAFTALTTLIVDLDQRQDGLLKVGQESMISLQKGMQEDVK